ncbi:MAG: tetratricopeptide repeat protein [Candidatus Rokubacteria bacterium]|nr:tetratricopeptide repeat protein [Candidatus Rokubacteria bacterium]
MTAPENFDRFSERLDRDWTRSRMRAATGDAATPSEEELLRALGRADPLAEHAGGGWWEGVRSLLAPWPARLGVGAAIAALILIGFALGRVVTERDVQYARALPPMPAYAPEARSGLGAGASVKPQSLDKFREAMAFHPTPEFAAKALPLLRESVALDPAHDEAQFWLGVALLHLDQPDAAIVPLEQAVRLAPADPFYKQYLMFAYLRTGAVKQATAILVELMRGRPR